MSSARPNQAPDDPAERDRQRLDKWLWFARLVRTRSLAARLVQAGHVRVNGVRVLVPAKAVGPGDVLTVSLERDVRVLRIIAGGSRRGPASEARGLFDEVLTQDPSARGMRS